MNIGVLGTGVVGSAIATALTEKGHNVRMGSRTAENAKAQEWVKSSNDHATQGDFYDAASFGDMLFICLNGEHALSVIKALPADATGNKIIIDITNPLDFSKGMPPRIMEGLGNHTSLGEEIQKAIPNAHVVKTLNTVNYKVMVNAREVNGGDHHLFLCGNNTEAKNKAREFLAENFHWETDHLIDLGGIENARVTEAIVPFWVTVMQAVGSPVFNFKIVR